MIHTKNIVLTKKSRMVPFLIAGHILYLSARITLLRSCSLTIVRIWWSECCEINLDRSHIAESMYTCLYEVLCLFGYCNLFHNNAMTDCSITASSLSRSPYGCVCTWSLKEALFWLFPPTRDANCCLESWTLLKTTLSACGVRNSFWYSNSYVYFQMAGSLNIRT